MALFQEDSLDFISLWLRYHSVKWSVFAPFVIWLFLCMKGKKENTVSRITPPTAHFHTSTNGFCKHHVQYFLCCRERKLELKAISFNHR